MEKLILDCFIELMKKSGFFGVHSIICPCQVKTIDHSHSSSKAETRYWILNIRRTHIKFKILQINSIMSKTLLLFLSVRGVLSTLTTSTRPISGRSLRVLGSVNLTRNFHFGQAVMSSGGSSDKPTSDAYKELTNEEWAKRLEPEQYFVTRERGTEAPFSGKYYNHKGEGVYTCICCGSDLFSSKTKYDSGSGWPSFYDALQNAEADGSATGILRRKDVSHGMVRDEILCKNCNAHLGHVFDDGPQPTGTRYCVNSCALKFQPRKL